jgi:hypothetical protein
VFNSELELNLDSIDSWRTCKSSVLWGTASKLRSISKAFHPGRPSLRASIRELMASSYRCNVRFPSPPNVVWVDDNCSLETSARRSEVEFDFEDSGTG